MGWAFKGLDGGDNRGMACLSITGRNLDSPQNDSDLSHTAFGATGDIPSDFVAPTTATSKSKLRQKTTSNKPRIYRKRATRPTASSSAKTHPGDGNQSSCSSLKSPLRRPKKPSGKSEKPNAEPVDFVYDINVRRKLREQLDAERMRVLHEATAREARLRAENNRAAAPARNPPPPACTPPRAARRTLARTANIRPAAPASAASAVLLPADAQRPAPPPHLRPAPAARTQPPLHTDIAALPALLRTTWTTSRRLSATSSGGWRPTGASVSTDVA
ncbi:hypothetical protein ON010_g8086 [Phytophthora cinnamomi]|nr:hypothetical protein ON010_g8086 [Phytophthora cinnamomi]